MVTGQMVDWALLWEYLGGSTAGVGLGVVMWWTVRATFRLGRRQATRDQH